MDFYLLPQPQSKDVIQRPFEFLESVQVSWVFVSVLSAPNAFVRAFQQELSWAHCYFEVAGLLVLFVALGWTERLGYKVEERRLALGC